MKKLFLILFVAVANGQIVNIPDAVFKTKLLAASPTNTIAYAGGIAIKIDTNNDNEIQESEAAVVEKLDMGLIIGADPKVSDLTGLLKFVNLQEINFSYNNITGNVDLSSLHNLKYVYLRGNYNINYINVSSLTQLEHLDCMVNNLISIDFQGNINLKNLLCSGNNSLNNINFSQMPNLEYLHIENVGITNLDVSSLTHLTNLFCGSSSLEKLNLKNGSNENVSFNFVNNFTNLTYVCTDDSQLQIIQNQLTNYQNITYNSYCTFVPGGIYNTIKGSIKIDNNNNGCDNNDQILANVKVTLNNGTTTGSTFTNANGGYTFYTGVGTYTISNAINTTLFNIVSSTQTVTFTDSTTANTVVNDFCLSPNGAHKDVEVVLVPVTPARPGFDAVYKLVYRNLGNMPTDITANLIFNDAVLDVVSVSTPTSVSATGSLSWFLPNVLPFQSGAIMITLKVNAPTATPPVNIGAVLNFTTSATINGVDENPADNTFPFAQTVVGSYDPNDITCLEGKSLPPSEIGKYLHYAVNFENTGTYYAENVVVKQVIDTTKFDVQSMQQQFSSHNGYTKITDNVIEFMFKNINLAAASGTPPVGGGHGTILYKMKTKSNLIDGEMVSKKAKIYFDYNFPIDTNNAETSFISLSNEIITKDNSISVYPNPTQDVIKIKANSNILKIDLFDTQGRLLETNLDENSEATFDLTTRTKGIYFLKTTTENGSGVEKIVKK